MIQNIPPLGILIILVNVIVSLIGFKDDIFFNKYNKIVGNLPYYISSEILIKLCKINKTNKKITLMLQKEVADRIASPAG